MDISNKTAVARKIKATGVREVGRTTGVHYSTISMWLNGRRDLSLSQAARLAKAVGFKLKFTK